MHARPPIIWVSNVIRSNIFGVLSIRPEHRRKKPIKRYPFSFTQHTMPARRSPSDEPMVRETECYADPNLWYRAGSTPVSCVSAEAQSIGSPLPLPDAFSYRRVNDFDDRLTP